MPHLEEVSGPKLGNTTSPLNVRCFHHSQCWPHSDLQTLRLVTGGPWGGVMDEYVDEHTTCPSNLCEHNHACTGPWGPAWMGRSWPYMEGLIQGTEAKESMWGTGTARTPWQTLAEPTLPVLGEFFHHSFPITRNWVWLLKLFVTISVNEIQGIVDVWCSQNWERRAFS